MCKRNIYSLTLLISIIAVTSFLGCKKKGIDKTTVSFVNQLSEDVTLYIYDSKEAYGSNSGYIEKTTVYAGEVARFEGNLFVQGRTYYMDWFSADYYYNNWYNDNFPIYEDRVRFKPETGNNTYYIQQHLRGNNRKAFLNGENASTSWIAIGAFLYSNNTGYSNQWNVISNNERYREVTINKDGTADYTYRNSFGDNVSESLQVMIHESDIPFIEFKDGQGNTLGNMTGGKLPTATPPSYATEALDTVMALFPDNEYIFMMLRQ